MHILIIGAAGMIGVKLTNRLVKDKALAGKPIDKATLVDVVAPAEARRARRSPSRPRRSTCRRRAWPSASSPAGRT